MMRNNILLEKVKSVLLIFLLFTIASCADKYERNIEKHFKKFILTEENKMEDYEIATIQRKKGDTLTQRDIEIQTIENKNYLLQNEISYIKYWKRTVKLEIDNLAIWKRYFVSGYYMYADRYPQVVLPGGFTYTINSIIPDEHNVGKERLILERKNEIKKMDSTTNVLLSQKKDNQKVIDSLRNKPDKTILELSSVVKVKGMEASGTKKIQYKVVQYGSGEIKTVKQIR